MTSGSAPEGLMIFADYVARGHADAKQRSISGALATLGRTYLLFNDESS
jgi:hypothetical protein